MELERLLQHEWSMTRQGGDIVVGYSSGTMLPKAYYKTRNNDSGVMISVDGSTGESIDVIRKDDYAKEINRSYDELRSESAVRGE